TSLLAAMNSSSPSAKGRSGTAPLSRPTSSRRRSTLSTALQPLDQKVGEELAVVALQPFDQQSEDVLLPHLALAGGDQAVGQIPVLVDPPALAEVADHAVGAGRTLGVVLEDDVRGSHAALR